MSNKPETAQIETHNHTLKKAITYRGVPKKEGDKVSLRPDQAKRLRDSGHI